MAATHEYPLPGDLVIRPAENADHYLVSVYPHSDQRTVAHATLSVTQAQALVIAAKRGGGVQVWREDGRKGSRYRRVAD